MTKSLSPEKAKVLLDYAAALDRFERASLERYASLQRGEGGSIKVSTHWNIEYKAARRALIDAFTDAFGSCVP